MVTEILKPATIQEALKARALPGTAFLGGGTWLNAARSTQPVTLISLEKLGLQSIDARGNQCVLGAAATFQQIVDDPALPAGLRAAAGLTASRTLRNMMTIGGEIALHPPDSALVPLLLAMEAEISLAGKKKPVPIRDFLSGGGDGLILSVVITKPLRPAAIRAVSRTSHGPRSLVVAACAETLQPEVSGLRVVVADCRGSPVRLSRFERSLEGRQLPSRPELESAFGNEFSPVADVHASSRYKAYMTRVLVADALETSQRGKAAP
jgi:probable selenate reductase FAD-binding subunit